MIIRQSKSVAKYLSKRTWFFVVYIVLEYSKIFDTFVNKAE